MLVPRFPGITSGLGCVLADVRHDFVRSVGQKLLAAGVGEIEVSLAEQAAAGRRLLDQEGVPVAEIVIRHEADLLFGGQSHVFRVPVASPFDPPRVLADFARRYKERFDIELPEMQAMLVNLRTTVIGRRTEVDLAMFAPTCDGSSPPAVTAERQVYFRGGWHRTAIYDRGSLTVGVELAGPAIVEQADTTIVLDPGATARVDALGNLVIAVGTA